MMCLSLKCLSLKDKQGRLLHQLHLALCSPVSLVVMRPVMLPSAGRDGAYMHRQ